MSSCVYHATRSKAFMGLHSNTLRMTLLTSSLSVLVHKHLYVPVLANLILEDNPAVDLSME